MLMQGLATGYSRPDAIWHPILHLKMGNAFCSVQIEKQVYHKKITNL